MPIRCLSLVVRVGTQHHTQTVTEKFGGIHKLILPKEVYHGDMPMHCDEHKGFVAEGFGSSQFLPVCLCSVRVMLQVHDVLSEMAGEFEEAVRLSGGWVDLALPSAEDAARYFASFRRAPPDNSALVPGPQVMHHLTATRFSQRCMSHRPRVASMMSLYMQLGSNVSKLVSMCSIHRWR